MQPHNQNASGLKTRLIPCLFLKNGFLVRSEQFKIHQSLGNAIHQVERFNAWDVDELIYLDISKTVNTSHDTHRKDLKIKTESSILDILETVSKTCFMPLTFGGNIRTLNDIHARISRGADKVSLNTATFETPELIEEAAKIFGSQALIASVDVWKHKGGQYEVYSHHGQNRTGKCPFDWIKTLERMGIGEILLTAIQHDGMAGGYDIPLIARAAKNANIPVIACGGVGQFQHFSEGVINGHADAVAAGNIFHFTELSAQRAKQTMRSAGIQTRCS